MVFTNCLEIDWEIIGVEVDDSRIVSAKINVRNNFKRVQGKVKARTVIHLANDFNCISFENKAEVVGVRSTNLRVHHYLLPSGQVNPAISDVAWLWEYSDNGRTQEQFNYSVLETICTQ